MSSVNVNTMFPLRKILTDFKKEEKNIRAAVERLKKKKPGSFHQDLHDLHDDAFRRINCLNCANCCKNISPILNNTDIERLAGHLKMKLSQFTEMYVYMDEDGDYVFKKTPCPFLNADNYCSVYEFRPKACREYPHTDHKNGFAILTLSLKNCTICPAVLDIFTKLAKKY